MQRIPYTTDANGKQVLVTDRNQIVDDALGGRAYYLGRPSSRSRWARARANWGCGRRSSSRPAPVRHHPAAADRDLPDVDRPGTGKPSCCRSITPIADSAGQPAVRRAVATDATNAGADRRPARSAIRRRQAAPAPARRPTPLAPTSTPPFLERFLGNSPKPRLSVGFGVNWNSPFGPLRIDVAKALLKQKGDDTKLVTFNVGTQF